MSTYIVVLLKVLLAVGTPVTPSKEQDRTSTGTGIVRIVLDIVHQDSPAKLAAHTALAAAKSDMIVAMNKEIIMMNVSFILLSLLKQARLYRNYQDRFHT